MAKFCGKCGAKLDEETGLCPNCDKNAPEWAKVQKNGRDAHDMPHLQAHTTSEKQSQPQKGRPPKKKAGSFIRRLLIVFIVLAIVGISLCGVLTYLGIVNIPLLENVMQRLGLVKTSYAITDEESSFGCIDGSFTSRKITDEASALAAIGDAAGLWSIEDEEEELAQINSETVKENTYYKFGQIYKGIPVFGRSMTISADSNGQCLLLTGNYQNLGTLDITTRIDEDSAIQKLYEESKEGANVQSLGLAIYSLGDVSPVIAWHLMLNEDGLCYDVFISANSGEVIARICDTYTDRVEASGVDIDNVSQSFYVEKTDKEYELEDTDKNLVVYNANESTLTVELEVTDENGHSYFARGGKWVDESGREVSVNVGENGVCEISNQSGEVIGKNGKFTAVNMGTANFFTALSSVTSKTNSWEDAKAVTLMSRLSKIYDYWVSAYDKYGHDGKFGRTIGVYNDLMRINLIQTDSGNAYSWGLKNLPVTVLSFGSKCSLSVDVIAHEYMHAVERGISSMIYAGESGALMEAYSDIFGEILQDWCDDYKDDSNDNTLNDSCDWIHNGIRNLIDPGSISYPYTYKGKYWASTEDPSDENDHGGVHTNNTVISHAAYLMWIGIDETGSFARLNTKEISELFYSTLWHIPSDCTFMQFASTLLKSAETMTHQNRISYDQYICVEQALRRVGLIEKGSVRIVAPRFDLTVLDINGEMYNDCALTIKKIDTSQNISLQPKEETVLHTDRLESTPSTIELNPGLYQLEVADLANKTELKTITLLVQPLGEDELTIFTSFGMLKPKSRKTGQFNQNDIPDDALAFNGHYYRVYEDASVQSYEQAAQFCSDRGGYLATITAAEENDVVYSYIRSMGYQNAFFGYTDAAEEGKWVWTNQETGDYTNWHSGEPNSDGANENYVMFYEKFSDGTWNDSAYTLQNAEENTIRVDSVQATSALVEGTVTHVPERMLDNDLSTAWTEGTNNQGYGESVLFTFPERVNLSGFRIRTSLQKSVDLFYANSRPKVLTATFDDGTSERCALEDTMDEQYIKFSHPFMTNAVSLTIEEVYPGNRWEDTCISEIKFMERTPGTAFICEWGEYEVESEVPDEPLVRETSDERDIVLVLDVSGSMSGTPLEETKKAASSFVDTALDQDASVGIVAYDDYAEIMADFSVQKAPLQEIIPQIYGGGGTNIEAGLSSAYEMLHGSSAKKRIIVLMSDGEPNDGKQGDDLVSFADEIKDSGVLIYTLGFFESLYDRSAAQHLMERLASDGCHYEVENADDLVFFFEDIADQINGQKYIYIRIACPVDVSVTYNGQTLSSAAEDLNQRTDFGTLTFEENEEKSAEGQDDLIKVLRLKEGADYDLKIVGTGRGLMDYTIGFMDENGDYSDLRRFENVKITKRTVIDTVAATSRQSVLNIDEDGDGKYDLKLRAEENGYGEEIAMINWSVVLVGVGSVAALITILTLFIKKKKKGKVH